MARTAVGRSAWLMYYNPIPLKFKPTDPTRTRTILAELFCPAAPFPIMRSWFSSKVKNSEINSGGKDESHSAVTACLKSYGFSEVEIGGIVKKYPKILSCRVSTNLKPKLDYLVECGFNGSALHSVIASDPFIFVRSLHKHIKPRYQFLEAYLKESVNLAIVRSYWLLSQHTVESGVEYLKKQGVPVECLTKLLAAHPRILAYSQSRMAKLVEATKGLGVEPGDTMYVWYIRMFGSMSETSWKKKVEVFKSLGWSDQDIRATLSRYPFCFQVSEKKLRGNMDFYVKIVKIEQKAIIALPNLLMLSLNGRIFPRYEVMKLLKEHNLLKVYKPSTFFGRPEKQFIRSYIEKNLEQVPHLLQVYSDSRKAKADTPRLHS